MKDKFGKDIPIIEYTLDEETGDTFNMVAFTKSPAILSKGVYFSDEDKEQMKRKIFADEEQMIVIAPVIIPMVEMKPRVDVIDGEKILHQPIFTEEGIQGMYKEFMDVAKSTHIFNYEHTKSKVDSFFFEIWKKEDMFKDKSALYGLDHPINTVYMAVQVTDKDQWEVIKKEGAYGFSIEGFLATKKYGFSDDKIEIERYLDSLSTKQMQILIRNLLH